MRELGELQPILSVGQTVEEYFSQKMLELATQHSALAEFKPNIRNEAYENPDSHCPCCGKAYENPDF